jgi:hypothetical protein
MPSGCGRTQAERALRVRVSRRPCDATKGLTVIRLANGTGTVNFPAEGLRFQRAQDRCPCRLRGSIGCRLARLPRRSTE